MHEFIFSFSPSKIQKEPKAFHFKLLTPLFIITSIMLRCLSHELMLTLLFHFCQSYFSWFMFWSCIDSFLPSCYSWNSEMLLVHLFQETLQVQTYSFSFWLSVLKPCSCLTSVKNTLKIKFWFLVIPLFHTMKPSVCFWLQIRDYRGSFYTSRKWKVKILL